MASISTDGRNQLIALYTSMLNAAPGATNLNTIVNLYTAPGGSLLSVANTLAASADFGTVYPSFLTSDEFATRLAANLLGSEVSAADTTWAINWVKTQLGAGQTAAQVITSAVQALWTTTSADFLNAKAMLVNKVDVASYYSVDKQQSSTSLTTLQSVISGISSSAASDAAGKVAVDLGVAKAIGQIFTLTTGIDPVVGTAGNDTINGNGTGLLSALDSIDGGNGSDTLNITDTLAITSVPSATVKNVEVANIVSALTISEDTSGWTGLTTLTATGIGGVSVIAPAATGVTVSNSSAAATTTAIQGGTTVTLTASGITGAGVINVGTTTAAKGVVTVTASESSTAATSTADAINVTGGTTVNITANLAGAVGQTITAGVVTVVGTADTTAVSVVQSKAATASLTVAGVVNNSVNVTDVNYASATKAGTITGVVASGFTTLSINDNALTALSVTNGSGNIIIDNSGLTTATNKTLALTINGETGGTLDDADIYTALNVTATGANSTLANITDSALTALTVTGDKALTLTSTAGLSALKTVTVSATAGLTADLSGATVTAVDTSGTTGTATITLDGTKATYTGGAGVDKVTLSTANSTKAISLGDGNDTLTLAAGTTAPTAAISGGNGTDVLKMDATSAATASGSATFAGKVSGFEQLTLTGATNQTIDLAALGNYNYVSTAGGNGLTLSNIATGGTLALTGAGTAYTLGSALFTLASNTSDVLNFKLTDGSGAGVAFASTGITATGVENIAITTADTQVTPSGTFNDTLTLVGNSASSISVGGNAGLTLTATDTALTSLDASGITLGGFTFTSGALAAAATIKGSATGTNTIDFSASTGAVTYTGGTGADAITANHAKADVITLGNGANSVTGGAGNFTITGGTGADTVNVTSGNNTVSLGDGANSFTATSGNNTYTGGAGVDTITVGGGVNTITTGTGADIVTLNGATANGNSYSTITDAHSGLKLTFGQATGTATFTTAKIALASTAAFQDFLDAAAAGNGATSHVSWFQYTDGNTYIVEDNGVGTTFSSGVDTVVKLTGLVDLSTATFAAVAGASASLTLA